jgi:hypothetical protein
MDACLSLRASETTVPAGGSTHLTAGPAWSHRLRLSRMTCHYLPHLILNSDTNTNIIEYEYKMDISNSDLHSNTYSVYSIDS